jgi:antitoxin component YwqK of YwqJK toxin-antitoxin module
VLVLACSFLSLNGLAQDKVTYYYPDSTISSSGTLLNGRPHGSWVNYYPDGNLKSKGNWYRGLLDSTWNFFFHTGDLKLLIQYEKGIKNGYAYTYAFTKDSIHYLSKKELFVDGMLEGKTYQYNSSGDIKRIINFRNNVKEGSEIIFSEKNHPATVYIYENNRLVTKETVNQTSNNNKEGTWIQLDKNFNIINTQDYSNDSIISNNIDAKFDKVKYTIEGLTQQIRDTAFQGQFINGVPIGRHILYDSLLEPVSYIIYDSLGHKIEEGKISDYKLNGKINGYYTDGSLKYTGSYVNNLRQGLWKYFYPNGILEQKGSYSNGKLNGKWLWFYKNKDTLRLETYRYGKRNGLYLSYDPYGVIIQKGYFDKDLKQEFWIENTGEFILRGNYFDGSKNDEWIGTYDNGKKAYIGNYLRGKPDGKHIYYYKNGNKRKIEFYETGRQVGHWQYFKKNGQLYKVKSYNKGESIFIKE